MNKNLSSDAYKRELDMKEKKREVKITPRERKLLEYISAGYNDNEIAELVDISYYTVRTTFARLLGKSGTVSRPHLVAWAYKEGILK